VIEVMNVIFPIPTGRRTLDTYGKVISGKINDEAVNIAFIMKFVFSDFL